MAAEKKQRTNREVPDVTVEISKSFYPDTAAGQTGTALGTHVIADFWGARYLSDVKQLERVICLAVEASRATLLHIHLHRFDQGNGVTGVALLAESHISVHTWPERNYAAFDLFMCGDSNPQAALQVLRQELTPTHEEIRDITRGAGRL